MTTHETLVAARAKAQRDLEHLLRTAADSPRSEEQITAAAEKYLADQRENGFIHRAELHAPPEPPAQRADPEHAAATKAAMVAELSEVIERHKREEHARAAEKRSLSDENPSTRTSVRVDGSQAVSAPHSDASEETIDG